MARVILSPVDAAVLRLLAETLDAGAELVEPSELVLRSMWSADDVDRALAAMGSHRPELFRAVLDADGRVVAVTGVTAAGYRLVRGPMSDADVPSGPAGCWARRCVDSLCESSSGWRSRWRCGWSAITYLSATERFIYTKECYEGFFRSCR
jgi:hypothetical protein